MAADRRNRAPRRRAIGRRMRIAAGRRRSRRRLTRWRGAGATTGARTSLRFFRHATVLAVAVTALMMMVLVPSGDQAASASQVPAETELPDTVSVIDDIPVDALQQPADTVLAAEVEPDSLVSAATLEAERAVRRLWRGFLSNLPKFIVAGVVFLLAGAVVRLVRPVLGKVLGRWEKASAATAMVGIAVWLLAFGIAISIIVGDIRALFGSLGLVGLALSWALQTPIESFTGWLMNSFQGYYRVGDRVAVGDVFGDVFRIDFLTTTVWEIGSLDRPGFVHAEQPTGRLITFPNSEVLAGSIVNLTRDFPYVWDELSVSVGNRTDLAYAAELIRKVAAGIIEGQMQLPATQYEAILLTMGLEGKVSKEVEVFVSLEESTTNLTVRYLVGARERRKWKSALAEALMTELNRPEHATKVIPGYPRRQIQFVDADERPANARVHERE